MVRSNCLLFRSLVMRTSVKSLFATALICTLGTVCFGEQIDNPTYKMWSKFKAGTSVTTKTVSDFAGQKSEMEITTTLKEISADKAVVETKMADMPAMSTDVP